MSIIEEHKLMFVHSAKTAGTSIANFFDVQVGHHSIMQYGTDLGQNFSSYRSFVIVRNPIDRFISAWNMIQEKNRFPVLKKEFPGLFTKHPDDALRENQDDLRLLIKHPKFAWFWPQVDLLFIYYRYPQCPPEDDDSTALYVPTYVLNFHTLLSDFEMLCKIENIPFDSNSFPHLEQSIKSYKVTDISEEATCLLADLYWLDFQLLPGILFQNLIDPRQRVPSKFQFNIGPNQFFNGWAAGHVDLNDWFAEHSKVSVQSEIK